MLLCLLRKIDFIDKVFRQTSRLKEGFNLCHVISNQCPTIILFDGCIAVITCTCQFIEYRRCQLQCLILITDRKGFFFKNIELRCQHQVVALDTRDDWHPSMHQ